MLTVGCVRDAAYAAWVWRGDDAVGYATHTLKDFMAVGC